MRELINDLLKKDLNDLAYKMGFINSKPDYLDSDKAVTLLNYAEKLSRRYINETELNECILICSLLWENRNPDWDNLSNFLKQILVRVGLTPAAIMIDESDEKNNYLTSSGDIFLDIENTKYINVNRIELNEKSVLLTKGQKLIWDSIDKYNRIGISAPTSAGKSFVLCLALINYLNRNDINAFYIVPNISLINQVSSDLKKILKDYNFDSNISIHQSYVKVDSNRNIFVLTQERAFAALLQNENIIPNLDLLIVDEVQNIERVTYDDNERADDLLTVLRLIHENINPKKIIISGPRIEKIDKLVKDLFDEQGFPIELKVTPVLNITYSFKNETDKFYLYQHNPISEKYLRIELSQHDLLTDKLFGRKRLLEPSIQMLTYLSRKLQDDSILLFASTKGQCLTIAKSIKLKVRDTQDHRSLIEYIAQSVNENYNMIECIKNGVAYHNANVPINIRNVIELAYKKNIIKLLATTTTLLQGINLPAKYLIARNHRLNARDDDKKLTPYEFANLRGRAGRLMKDFVGRAIIIDYKAFEDTQLELFDYPSKEVIATYEHRYNKHKDEIIEVLVNSENLSPDYSFNDLIVFLRNRIYRYGMNSISHFSKHNIDIDKSILKKIISSLSEINIPKDYCISNPHWDILQLQTMYNNRNRFNTIPKSPFDHEYYSSINNNLGIISEIAPYYYKKYLKIDEHNWKIDKILKLSSDWSQEKPLSEILVNRTNPITPEKIESHIEMLNTHACYNVPKLLKPIIYLQDKENPILSFMEYGAYTNEVKKMIEFGISREDAINIKNQFNYNFDGMTDSEIKKSLVSNLNKMDIWIQYQLNNIL